MTVSDIPDRHANINPTSRFPGNSQIPDPVNILIVFPIPAPYFGQIPNPENALPDPVWISLSRSGVLIQGIMYHVVQFVRLQYVLHYSIFYNECALSCASPRSLIIAHNPHFIVTGFEKGNFVNNDRSSSLRNQIVERDDTHSIWAIWIPIRYAW